LGWWRPAEKETRKNAARTLGHVPCAANAVKVDRFETAPGHPHIQQQTGAHSCAAESPMRTNQRNMGRGWIGSGGASGNGEGAGGRGGEVPL